MQKFSCIERSKGDTVEAVSLFYAHRTHPSVFEQDVTIRNTGSGNAVVQFDQLGWRGEQPFTTEIKRYMMMLDADSVQTKPDSDPSSCVVQIGPACW